MYNTYQNPYLPGNQFMQNFNPQPQQVQVVRVNGRNGAETYAIGPNSSALLLDESGTLVWLCMTDGAGYKTVTPYDITPHQTAPVPDFGDLETRIKKLEDFVNEYTGDTSTTQRKRDAESSAH